MSNANQYKRLSRVVTTDCGGWKLSEGSTGAVLSWKDSPQLAFSKDPSVNGISFASLPELCRVLNAHLVAEPVDAAVAELRWKERILALLNWLLGSAMVYGMEHELFLPTSWNEADRMRLTDEFKPWADSKYEISVGYALRHMINYIRSTYLPDANKL